MIDAFDAARLLADLDRTRLYDLFPESGPLRRQLYPKHLEFFAAGKVHGERAFVAANRVGKSQAIAFEATCHLIGFYPEWWEGRTFDRAVSCWAAGEDAKAVRETLQKHFLGDGEVGTGLIPAGNIIRKTMRSGIPDAVDFVEVSHSGGGVSRLVFKAYEQGRESFQGARVDVVLLDEEPPLSVYTECLTRTMSTVPGEESGVLMAAFTPLSGISATVLQFLPGGVMPGTEEARKEAWGWGVVLALFGVGMAGFC